MKLLIRDYAIAEDTLEINLEYGAREKSVWVCGKKASGNSRVILAEITSDGVVKILDSGLSLLNLRKE